MRGRDDALAEIDALLAAAADGRGGVRVVAGPAGSGKTALLDGAAGRAAGYTVLRVTCAEDEAGLPFAALHALLAPVLPAGLDRAMRTGDLAGSLAVADLLCRAEPVLSIVDDAQWMDPASAGVLSFVARRIGAAPVALLLAYGACDDGRPVPADILLDTLDQQAGLDLLDDLARARGLRLAGDVAGVLVAAARGIPGALVELASALTPEQARGDAAVPVRLLAGSRLRERYRRRVAVLPPSTRRLLLLAAADERLTVAELVSAATAAGHDIDDLAPAEEAGLVRLSGGTVEFTEPLLPDVVYDEATLAERRAVHRTLARTLDPVRERLRQRLHRSAIAGRPDDRCAAGLAEAARDSASHGTASTALERAAELTGDPARASAWLVDAARRAWLAGQSHRARLLLRGAGGARGVPEGDLLRGEIELRGGAIAEARSTLLRAAGRLTPDRAVGALLLAGEALCQAGEHARYADIARQALELRHHEQPRAAELMFEHFTGLAAMFNGQHARAVGPLRRVVRLCADLDEPVPLVRASLAALLLGDDDTAHRFGARAASTARSSGDLATLPGALELLACADFALGDYDAATAAALEGLRVARTTGQETVAADQVALLAVLAGIVGDWHTCRERIRQARPAGGPGAAGSANGKAYSLTEWATALLDVADGRPGRATERLKAIMGVELGGTSTGRGHLVVQLAATPLLVEAAARNGDPASASIALKAFDGWAASTGNPIWLALSARCHALVAESDTQAEEYFEEALRQHAAGDSAFQRARTEQLYGQELRRRRRPAAAREHIRSALATYRRFDAGWWAEQASAELRAAGDAEGAGGGTGTGTGSRTGGRSRVVEAALTAQQSQIARLVADGATNREVAARLFLSPRTVDHHMRNIFTRLGIRSRTELVRLIA